MEKKRKKKKRKKKKEKPYKTLREIISKNGRLDDQCKDRMVTLKYLLRD